VLLGAGHWGPGCRSKVILAARVYCVGDASGRAVPALPVQIVAQMLAPMVMLSLDLRVTRCHVRTARAVAAADRHAAPGGLPG